MSIRYASNTSLSILIAIALGITVGWAYPERAVDLKLLSDGFIKLVGLLMPFLLFVLVATGVAVTAFFFCQNSLAGFGAATQPDAGQACSPQPPLAPMTVSSKRCVNSTLRPDSRQAPHG